MENEETESNPWMIATIILMVAVLLLAINLQQPFRDNSDKAELSNLVKVTSDNGKNPIQLCELETGKCTPMIKFKQMEGAGVCTYLSHPTCKLFKQLGLVK